MQISSKCYYALRAVYELAEHDGPAPLKIAEIAERQRIPIKFLEAILNHLKGGGFVRSWRGAEGGYRLARSADALTVGEILRFMEGPIAPVDCVSQSRPAECVFVGDCAFYEFWGDLRQAISNVVDHTTFADLVQRNRDRVLRETYVADWTI
jgi:Rrf2 family protein